MTKLLIADTISVVGGKIEYTDIETVWEAVRDSYLRLCRKDHGRRIIIKYGDLRSDLAGNIYKNKLKFDSLFCALMDSEYGSQINLHGTLVGEYDKMENLRYRRRLYPFFSLTIRYGKGGFEKLCELEEKSR